MTELHDKLGYTAPEATASGLGSPGYWTPNYVAPSNAAPNNAAPGYLTPAYAAPNNAATGFVAPRYAAHNNAATGFVTPGYVAQSNAATGFVASSYSAPGGYTNSAFSTAQQPPSYEWATQPTYPSQTVIQNQARALNQSHFVATNIVVASPPSIQDRASKIKQGRLRFLAVVATIFFFPVGIPALICSCRSEQSYKQGNYTETISWGFRSLQLAMFALIFGVTCMSMVIVGLTN